MSQATFHLRPVWGLRACLDLTFALVALLSVVSPLRAEDVVAVPAPDLSAKFVIDPKDPERSVPTAADAMKNPLEMGYLMMDLIARADTATKSGDHAAAVRYYRALGKAVPERAVSFSKLCEAYEALGDRLQALESCKQALGKGGVKVDDYARFVHLTLQQTEPLSATQLEDVDSVVSHLRQQLGTTPEGQLVSAQLACEIGTRLEDTQRLQACTKQLESLAPSDPRTLAFRWALALKQSDFDTADTIVASARQARLAAPAIAAMESQLAAARDRPSAWRKLVAEWAPSAGLTLAMGLLLLVLARRRQTLGAV